LHINFEIYKFRVVILFLSLISFTPLLAQQRGNATFYSKRATGTRGASGVRIHHDSLICAHRTYPFGTLLKVTNPRNDKSVIVEVVDRGPFARGRIIDLSYAAAEEIGILSQGVATVEVELYREAPQIPFRPGDPMQNLPKIDLEVAEIGYSFIDDLKERKNERVDKLVHHPVSSAHSQHHTRSTSVKTANKAIQNTKPNETGKSPAQGAVKQQAKNQQSKKSAEEDNKWYNVFKKVKNYFVD
jgi:rare lipoprotein A